MGAAALALRLPALFNPWAMGAGHAALALVLLYKTIKLDAAGYSAAGIKDYYAAVWCVAWRLGGQAVRCRASTFWGWRAGYPLILHPLHTPPPPPHRRLNFYCEYLLLPFLAA